MLTNGVEDGLTKVVGLARADAVDVPQRVGRAGLEARQLAQRRVVEDDVGRHAAVARDAAAGARAALEQVAIDAVPRFGFSARERRGARSFSALRWRASVRSGIAAGSFISATPSAVSCRTGIAVVGLPQQSVAR